MHGDAGRMVGGIEFNSDRVTPGCLFVAMRGGYADGHDFLEAAVAKGAAAALTESLMETDVPQIVVGDTRAALPAIAAEFFGHPSRQIDVVGVTGTDGKTTTSHLLEAILAAAGERTGMIGTMSVRIGDRLLDAETRQTTPESVDVQRHLRRMVDDGVRVAIVEATSHGLDLHRLDAVRFRAGGVTNITHEHLEHHKTIPAYRRAKAILFERVAEVHGDAVINLDDDGARGMLAYAEGARVMTYGMDPDGVTGADLAARDVRLAADGCRFDLVAASGTMPVSLPMLGGFNVANALCALGLGVSLGVDVRTGIEALRSAPPVPGRMELIQAGQAFTVVVDYAHTPDSLSKVLRLLRCLNPTGRLIAVSGSAGERDVAKRPLQGAVSARLADYSVFTTEDPRFEDADGIIREIAEGAVAAGSREGDDFACVTDRRAAIRQAFEIARKGDSVLLAGKGHERSIIWGAEKRPWDEADVARTVLRERG